MNENKKGQMFSKFFQILLLEFFNTKIEFFSATTVKDRKVYFQGSNIGPAIRTALGMDRVIHRRRFHCC
jgi:hypothetical protein